MFTFFVVLIIISLIGLLVSLAMILTYQEPFSLWIILIFVCAAMCFTGRGILSEEDKDSTTPIIQEEQVEDIHQYKYCPYCGKEIK